MKIYRHILALALLTIFIGGGLIAESHQRDAATHQHASNCQQCLHSLSFQSQEVTFITSVDGVLSVVGVLADLSDSSVITVSLKSFRSRAPPV